MEILPKLIFRKFKRLFFSNRLGAFLFNISHPTKQKFLCPICKYQGPFLDDPLPGRVVPHMHCPNCASNVRMRLQYLAMEQLRRRVNLSDRSIYHFSPEPAMSIYFRTVFGSYYSAGISKKPVDCPADLTALPFKDRSCDFIFASHILEHIQDDEKAISEISRVLKSGGIAVLPVPIVQEVTVEYMKPNPHESLHFRAPGLDYFEKYRKVFSKVEVIESRDFDEHYQLFLYEDRTQFPTKGSPLKQPMHSEPYSDYVPICFMSD